MDSKKTSNWIDGIIQDLNDPVRTLEDSLRKTLVLAYILKNDKLKTWVESELNSYGNVESVPVYRKIRIEIWGDVSSGWQRARKNIHFQGAKHFFFEKLNDSGLSLTDSVASLETIIRPTHEGSGAYLKFRLSPYLYGSLEDLYPGWSIEDAWMLASAFTITGVLSRIKTNLLQFLLALNEELGHESNYSIMDNSEKVDRIFEYSIGYIHAENITLGTSYQVKGDQNKIVQGSSSIQQNSGPDTLTVEIRQLAEQIKELLGKADDMELDIKEDVSHQVTTVERQLAKSKPNFDLIGKSMQIIEALLLDAATSEYTPLVLEGIRRIYAQLISIT